MDAYGTRRVFLSHCREDASLHTLLATLRRSLAASGCSYHDLRPDNVLLAFDGSVHIADWDLASRHQVGLGVRGLRSSVEAPPFGSAAEAWAAELLERIDLRGASVAARPRLDSLAADEFRRPPEPAPVGRRSRLSLRQLEPWQLVLRILVRLLRKYLPGLAEPRWADTHAEASAHDGIDASTGHLSIRAPGASGTYPPPPARFRTPGDAPCRPTAPRTNPLPTPT